MRAALLAALALALTANAAGAAPRGLRIEITDGWASPGAWRDLTAAPDPAPKAPPPAAVPGAWLVQVGAFRDEAQARRALTLTAASKALAGKQPLLQPNGDFFRVRFSGFSTGEAARAACERLDADRLPCLVVPPV